MGEIRFDRDLDEGFRLRGKGGEGWAGRTQTPSP